MLAIALVIARTTMQEHLRDVQAVLPGSAAVPRIAGPTTGLVFDLLLCVPALLVLWRRCLDRDFGLRGSLASAFFGALAILAAASPLWSSDKFAAAVTASHLVAAAALMWAMLQLVRTWTHARLIAATCFAILLVFVAQGLMSRLIDIPDNIKYWDEHKSEILAQRGDEPGSFAATQFEQKLRSGELYGFNTSPNTLAALIVMLGTISAGAIIQRVRDKDEPGWAISIVIGILAAAYVLYFTYSRAAFATPILAAALLLLIPYLRAHWRRRLYWGGLASFGLGCIALIGHGLYHGTLLHQSLTYRWYYWLGSATIFAKRPLLGTGWSNFDSHYLRVRLPIAAEEVKDPHNLIVRAFVELGALGGVLMLGWIAASAWELTASAFRVRKDADQGAAQTTKAGLVIFLLCGGAMVLNIAGSVDFFLDGPDAGWFIVMELFKRGLFFIVLLLGFAAISLRSSSRPVLDNRAASWIGFSMIAAIAVFFIHNLIDFSLFETGAMFIFSLLLGAAIGMRGGDVQAAPSRRMFPIAILATALWIVAGIGVAMPVAIAEAAAQQAQNDLRHSRPAIAATTLRNTFKSLWITNADYASQAATALEQSSAGAEQVREMLDAAMAADPMRVESARAIAEYELRRRPDFSTQRITWGFERALALDPNNVAMHNRFADVLADLGQKDRAAREYQEALRYDDRLSPGDPKRLSPIKISEIQQKLASVKP